MPKIKEKAKVLGGKGVVFSYVTDVEKFYYREMVKGTNTYRYKLIKNAYTLDSAVDNCIEAYSELREEIKAIETGVELVRSGKDINPESDFSKLNRLIKKNRQKSREVSNCAEDYLTETLKKVESGLISIKTYKNKQNALCNHLLPYLKSEGVTQTIQISNTTFNNYPVWREASKSTRRVELILFKDFIRNYCHSNKLIRSEVDMDRLMPVIKMNESELDANPPLIEKGNWNVILKGLDELRKREGAMKNIRSDYLGKMFYRWVLIAKNSGLRSNVELTQLRWCDISRENVGRWSKTDKTTKDKWVAVIHVKKTKTGKQRTVPTNGVDSQLRQWKREQQQHIEEHYPWLEITEKSYIFGNPGNNMKPMSYSRFSAYWRKLMDICGDKLKPYVFSDRPYTVYSLRSTYICNLILQGKDIYTTAKLAGHTVAICEKYYAKLDMGSKVKQVTDFQFGVKGRIKADTGSYIEDDIEEVTTKDSQIRNNEPLRKIKLPDNWSKDDSNSYQRATRKDIGSKDKSFCRSR